MSTTKEINKDIQIIPVKKSNVCAGKTISAHEIKQKNKQQNKQTVEIKVKEQETEIIKRSEEPKLQDIEIKKMGRPTKENVLRGMDYYNEKRDDILKQKKSYYEQKKEERLKYQQEWYLKKRQEEYKSKHDGSLDGFTGIKKYSKK